MCEMRTCKTCGETKPLKPVDETDPKEGKFNDTY